MAVKAKAEITLSRIIDIESVTRYYLLQSSTASVPSKPTANPPGGNWKTTEPSYTSGSTNTLYFVDLTVMTNGTFSYSAVSKSSSYEAAKEAWNKANNAQNTADSKPDLDDVKDYVASRGENLVTNGTCLLRDNTNFSQFTYVGDDTYYAGGCFKASSTSSSGTNRTNDEYIPVDTSSAYTLSYWIKSSNASARYYDYIGCYDIDKKVIAAYNVMWVSGSTTTLAKDLKPGDTKVYLTSIAGFNKNLTNYWHRGFIFWNYKNSKGYVYPVETYSQYSYYSLWDDASAFNPADNSITLNKPWAYVTFPAGTPVSQRSEGSTFSYLNSDFIASPENTWIHKTGTIQGIGKNNESGKFKEGTAFVKVGWLLNREVSSGASCWLSTITFTNNASLSDVKATSDAITAANTAMDALADQVDTRITATETDIDAVNQVISNLIVDENGGSLMKQTTDGWVFSMAEIMGQVQQATDDLKTLEGNLDDQGGSIDALQNAVNALETLTSYVRITTEGDEPCIELGNHGAFKVRITNTSIDFMDGTSIPAYINNQSLKIDKAEVENELAFGKFAFKERDNGNMGLIWKG
jgi:hypothetical protein